MKNIHILPTDKPSKLFEIIQFNLSFDKENYFSEDYKIIHKYKNQNIYITSDEEIKEGDWVLSFLDDESYKTHFKIEEIHFNCEFDFKEDFKKVILTTDVDLIKDGIQTIDNEFLEWFCKNSSCKEIEVETVPNSNWGFDLEEPMNLGYRIIIPKHKGKTLTEQEILDNRSDAYKFIDFDKQETLEEAVKKYCIKKYSIYNSNDEHTTDFIAGAKWQQERSYSEEEVLRIIQNCKEYLAFGDEFDELKYFEQFKKIK